MNIEYLKESYLKGRDLIFDLDNTLINEKDYLYPAYYSIALKIYPSKKKEIFEFLKNEFEQKGRSFLYQKLKKKFKFNNFNLKQFKLILHENRSCQVINTYLWFKDFVQSLNSPLNLFIITNGNITQQKNKLKLINFPKNILINQIIYANQFNKKPSPDSFIELKKYSKISNPIYIGDSEVDQKFAENSNIEYFDISLVRY